MNFLSLQIVMLLRVASGAVINPLLASQLGAAALGTWAGVQQASSIVGAADLRPGGALRVRLQRATDDNERSTLLSAAYRVALWCVPISLISLLIAAFVLGVGGVDRSGWIAFAILALPAVFSAFLAIPEDALRGMNLGDSATWFHGYSVLMLSASQIAALILYPSLPLLACCVTVSIVFRGYLQWQGANRKLTWFRTRASVDPHLFKTFVRNSASTVSFTFSFLLLEGVDALAVAALTDKTTAGHYLATAMLFKILVGLMAVLLTAGEAGLAQLLISNPTRAHELMRILVSASVIVVLVAAAILCPLNGEVVRALFGDEYYLGTQESFLCFVSAAAAMSYRSLGSQLNALGDFARKAKVFGLGGVSVVVLLGAVIVTRGSLMTLLAVLAVVKSTVAALVWYHLRAARRGHGTPSDLFVGLAATAGVVALSWLAATRPEGLIASVVVLLVLLALSCDLARRGYKFIRR